MQLINGSVKNVRLSQFLILFDPGNSDAEMPGYLLVVLPDQGYQ